jgi:hypothetical protein
MIPPLAVFLASITGRTIMQDKGILSLNNPLDFDFGGSIINIKILASGKTIMGWAGYTPFGIE